MTPLYTVTNDHPNGDKRWADQPLGGPLYIQQVKCFAPADHKRIRSLYPGEKIEAMFLPSESGPGFPVYVERLK